MHQFTTDTEVTIEWHKLIRSLMSADWDSTYFSNQYFSRLLTVLSDPSSSDVDKLLAYRDALCASPIELSMLPLLGLFDTNVIKSMGLSIDSLGNNIFLVSNNLTIFEQNELQPIYRLQKRRCIKRFLMDPALSNRLNDDNYTHYNGAAQKSAIRVALTSDRNNTLLINLPTGIGKTLVAHALTVFSNEKDLTLVIVPTVGLAIEQGKRAQEMLQSAGMDHGGTYFWHGQQDEQIHNDIKERIRTGKQKILFTSPESACRSLLPILFLAANNNRLANIVIDEAHIVEQWGVSFRPDFQIFSALVHALREKSFSGIKCTLLSATLTENSLQVLTELFGVKGKAPIEVHGNLLRPEIQYKVKKVFSDVEHTATIEQAVIELAKPLIIYATEKDDANNIYDHLKLLGYGRIAKFTGATDNNDREKILQKWQSNSLDIIIATSAFGVGMDKGDVRSILHIAVPENLDRFYQEVGRSGRDGNASQSLLIYQAKSFDTANRINSAKLISVELGLKRWTTLWNHGKAREDGKRVIDISKFHQKLDRISIGNQEWNWRTLLLMQRSGLIVIEFVEPSPPEWDSSIEKKAYQKSLSSYYNRYYKEVIITPLVDNHLDLECWVDKVENQRIKEKTNQYKSFNTLKSWILNSEDKCFSDVLTSFYTMRNRQPEAVCGGCPSCKKNGIKKEYFPTLGASVAIEGIVLCKVWRAPLQRIEIHQKVYYKPPQKTVRSLMRDWTPWLSGLIEKNAIQVIRTDKEHINAIQKYLPKSLNLFWMYEPLDEEIEGSYGPELILVPYDSKDIPNLGLDESPRILFAQENTKNMFNSNRNWWVHDPSAKSLENFILSIK